MELAEVIAGWFTWLADKGWQGFIVSVLLVFVITLALEVRRINGKRLLESQQNLEALRSSTTAIENSTAAIEGVRAILGAIVGPQISLKPARRRPVKRNRRRKT